jgi:hypothetical protein
MEKGGEHKLRGEMSAGQSSPQKEAQDCSSDFSYEGRCKTCPYTRTSAVAASWVRV